MNGPFLVRLPYRTPPLSLNARQHWGAKARATKAVRRDVTLVLRSQRVPAAARVEVQLGYTPRDRRRRDTDNLVATLKAIADAVVDAGIVPDDTPEFMAKPEPIITAPDARDPHLWLLITDIGGGRRA